MMIPFPSPWKPSRPRTVTLAFTILTAVFLFVDFAGSVKHGDFKTCAQSGFCSRNRAFAAQVDTAGSSFQSPYMLVGDGEFADGVFRITVEKSIRGREERVRLPLTITFLESGTVRVQLDEEIRIADKIKLRHGSKANKRRYNQAGDWVLVGGLDQDSSVQVKKTMNKITFIYGSASELECHVTKSPFGIEFKRLGAVEVVFNRRNFLNLEHWREQEAKGDEPGGTENEGQEDQSTWWDETFGGATDSKPRGPEAIAMDFSFPGYEHVYGIPEHASSLSLKETRGGSEIYMDPYRLYNTDVFEYETNSPMTLYGSIPFMQAHRVGSTVGVFWLNGAETWVDIIKDKPSGLHSAMTHTHWISESGILDVFVFLGPTASDVNKAYGELTGYTQLPPLFSIAYHQCRWNYISDDDVKTVDRKFDKHNIPYDVMWLDIEYTSEKRYFTWDLANFKDPISMQEQLASRGRKLVVIIDPHIKKIEDGSYKVVEDMKRADLVVLDKNGAIYEGQCWPGASHWIDCFNSDAQSWWASLFQYSSFTGTTEIAHIWNDMNEPSVFSGPELTMPRDNLHFGNWEHRDLHNIYGLTFQNATFYALLARGDGRVRPFTLTRAFFAGSQRIGAMWTGDNEANWDHLAASFPMLLSSGVAGYPFAGADVPGYFGNPEHELTARWYQAGAFYPFFRGHAHIDTRRREPYMIPEPYRKVIVGAIQLRYALLPMWYTAFHQASMTGTPILTPMYYAFPTDQHSFSMDDQFLFGAGSLLVKPVVSKSVSDVQIYLPPDSGIYFDYYDFTTYVGKGQRQHIDAPLERIPILMRGGHVISRRHRLRRSSALMRFDPFTLVVAINETGQAEGTLYLDDGESYDYNSGAFIHRRFVFSKEKMTSRDIDSSEKPKREGYLKLMEIVKVERIILIGISEEWQSQLSVFVSQQGQGRREVAMELHAPAQGKAAWAILKNLKVAIGRDWDLDFFVARKDKDEL